MYGFIPLLLALCSCVIVRALVVWGLLSRCIHGLGGGGVGVGVGVADGVGGGHNRR